MSLETPEQVANDVYQTVSDFPTEPKGSDLRALMVRAIEADRAQHFALPEALSGVIQPTEGGVFVNDRGDHLVEPIGDENLELIYVRADGTTATGRGEWETGWTA